MKKLAKILTAAASTALLCPVFAINAHAVGSVEDICNAIRNIGFDDSVVRSFMNHYETMPHDENGMTIKGKFYDYDYLAEMIEISQQKIDATIAMKYGLSIEDISGAMADTFIEDYFGGSTATTAQTTAAQTTAPAAPVTDTNGNTVTQTTASAAATSAVTTTAAGSSKHSKEQERAFLKMTAEERDAFLNNLPKDERAAYLANMTPQERKALMKQLSKDDQADIINEMVDAAEQIGFHVTVDKIDNGQLDYSVRDSEGTLVDSTSLNTSVDDTGWDMTIPVIGSAGTILLSVGGFGWTAHRANKRREEVLHETE